MWGVYPGSKKKNSERYCCVGKHGPSKGYFERVPPGLTHLYRPRDGEFWCCDMHWDPPDIASDVDTPAKRTRRSSSASRLRTPMATTPSKSQSTSDFITPTKKIRRSPSSAVLDTPPATPPNVPSSSSTPTLQDTYGTCATCLTWSGEQLVPAGHDLYHLCNNLRVRLLGLSVVIKEEMSQIKLCSLMASALHAVCKKHMWTLEPGVQPATICATNRWAETVFRYMREMLNRQQRTRTSFTEAFVRGKRSSFRSVVDADPRLLVRARVYATGSFNDETRTYSAWCKDRLRLLLDKNRIKALKVAARDEQDDLLARLKGSGLLVTGDKLTVDLLKVAVLEWKRRNPHVSDMLRTYGSQAQLMQQFTDDILMME